ncbi:SHOCT domain-containing protein [Sphaerisporangium sp. NPDC005289]|uniref:SHOCT domain-containing protein n=1 Tax=Sphaerisporangium sp. NPDC005289 TaxID=3155247 RepID=UPI0033A3FE88
MGGWGYALMTLAMIAFWGLVIVGVVLLVRSSTGTSQTQRGSAFPSAEEMLAQRYARGEIDAEEYRARLDTLHGAHFSGPANG